MLISAEHLSINFGSRQLLDDVDFYLNEGDKTGVIGTIGVLYGDTLIQTDNTTPENYQVQKFLRQMADTG